MASTDQPSSAPTLRLVLEGEHAQIGDVDAADVTRLVDGAIRAVARAAEVIAGRQRGRVGRRGAATEAATRFRFGGIYAGSLGILLLAPDDGARNLSELDLEDADLTQLALTNTLDSLVGNELDAYVAGGLADLADQLDIGRRHSALRFTMEGGSVGSRSAVLDSKTRTRLHRVAAAAPVTAPAGVGGTLMEADFERLTARLRTSDNRTVRVTFTAEQADDIQSALRQQAHFDGVVTFDATTNQATGIQLRAVRRTRQLGLDLDGGEFWTRPTIADLAAAQGVGPADLSAMRDDTLSSDEVDRFLEALDS